MQNVAERTGAKMSEQERARAGFGTHVCSTVNKWLKHRPDLRSTVTQRNMTVKLTFKNAHGGKITSLQKDEIKALLQTFKDTRHTCLHDMEREWVICELTRHE